MSTSTVTLESAPSETASAGVTGTLLVCLPSGCSDSFQHVRRQLGSVYPGVRLIFAAPEGHALNIHGESVPLFNLPVSRSHPSWVLVASDYEAAAALAREHAVSATLVLGSQLEDLSDRLLQTLSHAVLSGSADFAFPHYTLHPQEGLVSAALLYPLTRTLYGAPVHLPLPLDFAFSAGAAERLGSAARRQASSNSGSAFLWPAAEAAVANLRVTEIQAGAHSIPSPGDIDLNALLGEVLGSAFTDIESKATFWQRARVPSTQAAGTSPSAATAINAELDDITPMVESFRNAFANLQGIWSLVLPPHSLLALKKLSLTPPAEFRMPPSLWARTVYEFVLAFHLRTLNRGHLLGAFTPLYLGWVASYIGQAGGNPETASALVEQNAAVFEAEKPYLVSRWRWPDRFNP